MKPKASQIAAAKAFNLLIDNGMIHDNSVFALVVLNALEQAYNEGKRDCFRFLKGGK